MKVAYHSHINRLNSVNHDTMMAQGFVYWVNLGYTTYYFNNFPEADYVAHRNHAKIESEEIVQCAYCRRYKINNNWIYADDIYNVTSGICPDCLDEAFEQI